ncbi:MAG: dTDP-4-dehydrorhamnose 3,5-epimerase [Acidobacteria bacterium]|nr:MAG: dTDP-4-dehydrorhamnose 3,5-epimerase [Acidobacteriota bacterium]
MIFRQLDIPGVYALEPERHEDERGFFARTYCRRELEQHGLEPAVAQCSVSYNRRRGTVRGMHYQVAPAEEAKLVRCTRGAIYDVVLDLRPESPAFKRHAAVELSERNRLGLYVPPGLAHGFQTLTDDAEVFYQISTFYRPDCARGVRWNDPAFAITWPLEISVISERDLAFPDFAP